MKHFVLDTSFFSLTRKYYHPETFPSFWQELTEVAEKGIISSVREVITEIKNFDGPQDHLLNWVEANKEIFADPTKEEQDFHTELMDRFSKLFSEYEKKMGKGNPWADPWLISRARYLNHSKALISMVAIVVSDEDMDKNPKKLKKIPDICSKVGVNCINTQKLMLELKWKF